MVNEIQGNKKSNKITMIIILVLIVLISIILGVRLLSNPSKKTKGTNDIASSDAFFIRDKNNNYALFNEAGKQLTDFNFKNANDLVNNTALVVNTNDEYGIINSKGKMVVDFTKYSRINQAGGLYEATGKDNKKFVIDSKGNVITELAAEEGVTSSDTLYSIINHENNYEFFNYSGKKILTVKKDENSLSPVSAVFEKTLISIFYNNKNYYLNVQTGKEMGSYTSENRYCIVSVDLNKDLVLLGKCGNYNQYIENIDYKLLSNNKVVDLKEDCDTIRIKDNSFVCQKDYKDYLLDENYKKSTAIANISYVDSSSYAQDNNAKVEFFQNSKKVNEVTCHRLDSQKGYMRESMLLLETTYGDGCNQEVNLKEYYTISGKKAFEKSFKLAQPFDENKLAIVSDDGEEYYLINTSGEAVSNKYDKITYDDGYYQVEKNSKYGFIDKNGKELIPCEYVSVLPNSVNGVSYVVLKTQDEKLKIFNLDQNKEVLTTTENYASVGYQYISVDDFEGHSWYYTLEGKLFFQV